jgi:membrane protein required for colicin V production
VAPLASPLPISGLNWVDFTAVALLLLFAWRGFRRGALGWIASLGAWLLALVGAFALAPVAAPLVAGQTGVGRIVGERLAFLVLLVVLRFVLGWAMRELVASVRPLLRALPPLDLLDHLLGVIPSLVIGALLVVIVVLVALLLPIDGRVRRATAESYIGRLTVAEGASAVQSLPEGGLLSAPDRILDIQRGLGAIQAIRGVGKVP